MESEMIEAMERALAEIGEWRLSRDRARREAQMMNAKLGLRARLARKRAGIGLRATAREMGCSAGFVVDLETGRRWWTDDHARDYYCALVRLGS